jgi:hypothetical protein
VRILKFIIACTLLTALSSCQKDYCIRCIDVRFGEPPIEGCSNDLEELELTRAEWESIGYTCVIFTPQ